MSDEPDKIRVNETMEDTAITKGGSTDRFVSHAGGHNKRALRKRFYTSAEVKAEDEAFVLTLDGRSVKTPGRAVLKLPTLALATAVADEWLGQGEEINPETMPLTKMANTAIDRISDIRAHVVDEIAGFGASDLLCYRAEHPEALVAQQAGAWDPLLAWAVKTYGAELKVTQGIVFQKQAETALDSLKARVAACSAFELAGLHEAVSLTGSLILGLAMLEHHLDAEQVFAVAHVDETWQAEKWGQDEEAEVRLQGRLKSLQGAGVFLNSL